MSLWQKIKNFFSKNVQPINPQPEPKVEQPVQAPVQNAPVQPEPQTKNPPWYDAAKKQEGKKETDSKFAAIMVPLWKKLFNRSIGTIATSTAAWCGLAMAAALYWGGQEWQAGGEMARNWGKYGVGIEWKKNGAPKGAIVWINHSGDCTSSKNNHVTQMNGDCTAEDMVKPNATFDGFGGNQQNTWKVSTYSAKTICAVRWPKDYPFPSKVTKSVKCTSSGNSKESTQ